jgi:rhodanese-related sulfurtransferase
LPARIDEVRAFAAEGQPQRLWLYCGSGFRASVAASMLDDAGVAVVHVDDDFVNAAAAGLPIETPAAAHHLGEAYAD